MVKNGKASHSWYVPHAPLPSVSVGGGLYLTPRNALLHCRVELHKHADTQRRLRVEHLLTMLASEQKRELERERGAWPSCVCAACGQVPTRGFHTHP